MKPIIIPSIRTEIHNEKSVKEKNNQKHEDNVEDIGNDIKKKKEKGWTHKRAKRVSFALDPLSKEGEKERGSLAWLTRLTRLQLEFLFHREEIMREENARWKRERIERCVNRSRVSPRSIYRSLLISYFARA